MSDPEFRKQVLEINSEATVILASKRIALAEVLSLTTGSMIPFEKGHDQPLTLQVGGRDIATGEAVKVGDKFGMRVRDIIKEPS